MHIELACAQCDKPDPLLDEAGLCPACDQLPGQLALTDPGENQQ